MHRFAFCALALLALAGCASRPARQDVVTAAVLQVLDEREVAALKPLQRQKLAEAGLAAGDVAARRLVEVSCGTMADGWWSGYALLPPGLQAARGDAVRVRVDDPGTNDYDGLNRVLESLGRDPASGRLAYRMIPDWRERGLRNNYERVPMPPAIAGQYVIVQGAYARRCKG